MEAAEELEEITAWLHLEGLRPDAPREAQLLLLWRALQHARSRLRSVTSDLEAHRRQHSAEMEEFRKSLEQIRLFTGHKDVLAQEIQDENERLKEQMARLIALQDAQISEVAKMLYQQGLTELIHSSASEQVAYLLVERASLLDGSDTASPPQTDVFGGGVRQSSQSSHKGASRLGQNTWKRLFGLHRAPQSEHSFSPPGADEASRLERECCRLERDLEEGSRRLATAHNEIRRLKDELESAHMTQKTYEAELEAAQRGAEQLRQQVDKLETLEEMVELRKAKDLNDRLDLEIRTLRGRLRCLDAERSSLQQTVLRLQDQVKQLDSALQDQVEGLQTSVEMLEATVRRQRRQLGAVQLEAERAGQLAERRSAELVHSQQTCRDLQNRIRRLQQQLSHSHVLLQDHKPWKQHTENSQLCEDFDEVEEEERNERNMIQQECVEDEEVMKSLTSTRDECETLKDEICQTLKCLDREQSKYHEMKQRHKVKLSRAKQKFCDVTALHNEEINRLQRELSLCSHSLVQEKELVQSINAENEKLLCERRRLIRQLDEEEESKKDLHLAAALSKRRVEFLEAENQKLGNRIFQLSSQLGAVQRSLQNMQALHFAQDVNQILVHQQASSSDTKSTGRPPVARRFASAETGYLNLKVATPPDGGQSESTLC